MCAASTDTVLPALPEVEPLRVAEGAVAGAPAAPGVYAVYDSAGALQYIGLSRKVRPDNGAAAFRNCFFANTVQVLRCEAT